MASDADFIPAESHPIPDEGPKLPIVPIRVPDSPSAGLHRPKGSERDPSRIPVIRSA